MQNEGENLLVSFLETSGLHVCGKKTKTGWEVENLVPDHLFCVKYRDILQHTELMKQPYKLPFKTQQVYQPMFLSKTAHRYCPLGTVPELARTCFSDHFFSTSLTNSAWMGGSGCPDHRCTLSRVASSPDVEETFD